MNAENRYCIKSGKSVGLLTVLARYPFTSRLIMPTKQQIEKLGNTLIYFAQPGKVSELSKTKILKLLFLLEEKSIATYGVPFLGFNFELWQFGPVEKNVYVELSEDLPTLGQYIRKVNYDDFYEANQPFNDHEFSQIDIELMDEIVAFARHKTAEDLVEFTHSKNSLWKKCAEEFNILKELENGSLPTSQYLIDFTKLFDENSFLKERYEQARENLEIRNYLTA